MGRAAALLLVGATGAAVLAAGVVVRDRAVARAEAADVEAALQLPIPVALPETIAYREEIAPLVVEVPASEVKSARLATATASAMRMRRRTLAQAETAIRAEVRRGGFAGAALVVGRGENVVVERGFGRVGWTRNAERVTTAGTIYDIASLTKVVGTTTAVMLLVEDGKLDLDAPVARYLPTYGRESITIRHLLTHTAGLPAWLDLAGLAPDAARDRILCALPRRRPGEAVEYSDLGFVILWLAAERAAGEPLADLLDRRVFHPLGMRSTGFTPGEGCARCAPTWRRADGEPVRGLVHDPTARALGGIAGNAGLFSTADDLARFAAMLANGGELDGVRILGRRTLREFTRRQDGAGSRALGFDTDVAGAAETSAGKRAPRAFGHTGHTGTSLWVDPDQRTWTVILSNRVYEPRARSRIQKLRRQVHERVAAAAQPLAFPATGPE